MLLRLDRLLLRKLMLLFTRMRLIRVLMDHCWGLNNDRVLDIWNWAIYDEVVDVIVCINVCYVLTRWIVSFRFWRLISIDYILHLKVVVLLKVFCIVPTRTLIIEINSAGLRSISIRLKVFRLQATLLNPLNCCRIERNFVCLRAGCFPFHVFNIQAGSYFLRLQTPLNRFNLMVLRDFLV